MFHWPFFTPKPAPAVTRYVVAPRQESLVTATKRINKHRELEAFVSSTTDAERIAINEVQHAVQSQYPVRAKSGRVYAPH